MISHTRLYYTNTNISICEFYNALDKTKNISIWQNKSLCAELSNLLYYSFKLGMGQGGWLVFHQPVNQWGEPEHK